MRIYVLVTSVDPLRVWIHKDGFLRFCTQKYEAPTNKNMGKLCMHLTNYAINKDNENFVQNNSEDIFSGEGSKRHLNWLRNHLKKEGHDDEMLFQEIEQIIVKTLISVQPSLSH